MHLVMKYVLLGLALTGLMSFELTPEETNPAYTPELSMFGDTGQEPDLDELQTFMLQSLGCRRPWPAMVAKRRPANEWICRDRNGKMGVSHPRLKVTHLNAQQSPLRPGLTCSKRKLTLLDLDGFVVSQFCEIYGWQYSLRLEITFGVPT